MKINVTKQAVNPSQEEIINISKELILLVNQDGGNIVKEAIDTSGFYGKIELILSACEAYRDFLVKNIIQNPRGSSSENNTKIIKYGTTLIFQLRKFITDESLSFVLGGNTKDGQLKEKTYSQDEIFSKSGFANFRVSFSNAQIELSSCIERLSALDTVQGSLAEQWAKVLKYGFTTDYKKENPIGNNEGIFHKNGPDINVYMKFSNSGRRKTLTYYYMLHGESPLTRDQVSAGKSYDRGWMYQWLKMNQDIEIDDGSNTPLYALMNAEKSVRENVAGIKSGDYGTEQYKYRNRRVITFNNMVDILNGKGGSYKGIIPSLKLLLNNKNQPGEAFSHLIHDFTTMNESEIKTFVAKRLEELGLDK